MSSFKSERAHIVLGSDDLRNLELLHARCVNSNRSSLIQLAIRLTAVLASGEVCLAKKTPSGELVEIPQRLLWL